ncbi:hypothetical protein J8N05_20515 [Streptomyces sp. BH-SS-21]|uniref:Uncharacterized protein n=1 Tax=Streptomyces liliiviolaceus TaxID=2823109 RepID=A0A941B870_9ACTN|nr:hypothetical protein [Streptomyces liliiviolaceus]MBQ0850557.1 hypothetical protein [Streptomyces liliiviolaceus]
MLREVSPWPDTRLRHIAQLLIEWARAGLLSTGNGTVLEEQPQRAWPPVGVRVAVARHIVDTGDLPTTQHHQP